MNFGEAVKSSAVKKLQDAISDRVLRFS